MSVRKCARIQTFPDNFIFEYTNIADGYKMVGNAVPVKLAEKLGRQIAKTLFVKNSIASLLKVSKPIKNSKKQNLLYKKERYWASHNFTIVRARAESTGFEPQK